MTPINHPLWSLWDSQVHSFIPCEIRDTLVSAAIVQIQFMKAGTQSHVDLELGFRSGRVLTSLVSSLLPRMLGIDR